WHWPDRHAYGPAPRFFGGQYVLLGLCYGGFLRVDGGARGFGVREGLLILLAGDIVAGHQGFIALHILSSLVGVRLGHTDVGFRSLQPRPGGSQRLLGPAHLHGSVLHGRARPTERAG